MQGVNAAASPRLRCRKGVEHAYSASNMLPHGKQDLSVVAAHQAEHMQAETSAALQREAALVEEKGQLKLALATALEQKASTSGALAEAEGRLQEATRQVWGLRQSSRAQDGKPSYSSYPLPGIDGSCSLALLHWQPSWSSSQAESEHCKGKLCFSS